MGVSDARGCHAVTRCMIMHGGRDGSVTERDAGCRPLSLAFSIEGSIEGRAHGCRLGAYGRRDRARYGRPARRAALAGPGGRALFAGSHHPILRVRSHGGGYLVRVRSALVWLRLEHENHPASHPHVIVLVHAPIIGRIATFVPTASRPAHRQRRGWGIMPATTRGAVQGPFWAVQDGDHPRRGDRTCPPRGGRAGTLTKPDLTAPGGRRRWPRGTLPACPRSKRLAGSAVERC